MKLKAPIHDWEEQGLLTIVDEPSIDPLHIVLWFDRMRETYGLEKVIADNFRMDLLRPLFEDYGIEIEVIKILEQSNHYLHLELKPCSLIIILYSMTTHLCVGTQITLQ